MRSPFVLLEIKQSLMRIFVRDFPALLGVCFKTVKTPSWSIFFAGTALIGLEIRQNSCVQSPCLTKKSASIRHSAGFKTDPGRKL